MVVAMLISFPTNVRKLPPDKEIPSYGRFSEKGSKTSKIRKLTRLFTWPPFSLNFQCWNKMCLTINPKEF